MDNFREKRGYFAEIHQPIEEILYWALAILTYWVQSKMLASIPSWLGCRLMKRHILGLVLAGGQSKRLGRDKAMISFHGGQTQLEYSLSLLDAFCSRTAISSRENQRCVGEVSCGAELVLDLEEVKGPMSGVMAGLRAAQGWPILALACDMPMVDGSLVLRLLSQRDSGKLASCFIGENGRPEPLLAIYEANAMEELQELSRKGEFSLRHFLESSDVERVPCRRPQLLASVNTLEDLGRIKEKLAEEST